MDFFEKTTQFKEMKERFRQQCVQLNDEIESSLYKKFIDMPYQLKQVEANYEKSSDIEKVRFYYPILNVPKEFKKIDEKFYRVFYPNKTCIHYYYTLIDKEERKITILEQVDLKAVFCKIEETSEMLWVRIPSENIKFEINILEKKYDLSRNTNYEQLMKEVSKKIQGTLNILVCFD